MNNDAICSLCDLFQLDVDAVAAYEQALSQIDNEKIRTAIETFRDDHLKHIEDLGALIKKLGGQPPECTKDFKGFVIQGFTAMRSVTGTMGALNAMETNEELTNKNYKDALKNAESMDNEVKELIKKNYADEQHHLDYIRINLKKLAQA